MYLLGIDIGSSSVKVALIEAETKQVLHVAQHPKVEMDIISEYPGWAEQDPQVWWKNLCLCTKEIINITRVDTKAIKSIGISYQMHGLVLIDADLNVLRPAIIWCDSRAVSIGDDAFQNIGSEKCLTNLMNSPGNFTASKLKWVKENEPELYQRVYKMMLPGDYIAMKLTGEVNTTITGLSEGVLWNFKEHQVAQDVMDYFGIDDSLLPDIYQSISIQGSLTKAAALETGLCNETIVSYRAGDQPNNALSLGVLNPGQIAATGGTSGVVYGIIDTFQYDSKSRVNNFAHVNHSMEQPRIGVLLCINGTGISYSYIRRLTGALLTSYPELEEAAAQVTTGSDGLRVLPFGNGAERVLENKDIGAHYLNVAFNRHTPAHFYRATLEGIAFSFVYGIHIMREMGLQVSSIRAGNDNLFQSRIFSQTLSDLADCKVEIVNATGAIGAARASGVAIGVYATLEEACQSESPLMEYLPQKNIESCLNAYQDWLKELSRYLQD